MPLSDKNNVCYYVTDDELFDVIDSVHRECGHGVLQSDNGREFANRIIEELKTMWPELSIVHGKPRHSQNQGSVERANQNVQKILFAWLEDNKTNRWSEGLKFCQLQKNCAYHTGIRQTPFEVMFGRKAHVGIQTLPDSIKKILQTEEELESTYINLSTEENENTSVVPKQDDSNPITNP
ncbi:KRAB-A domain-containing protein 2-like, partial [Temnothorax curvispinosus]|uniref:KRAB-A domain-containing protein 2-like n=1 Tax=Temnothorax curvispinosus TaxID=300111 RepID=A0A6J1Q6I6_9HYME